MFNYMNKNVGQRIPGVVLFEFYLALQSKIRLFTASEVDCIFCPVIRCLSMTMCTASSWLAGKQKHKMVLEMMIKNFTNLALSASARQLTCVWSTTVFHKVLYNQGQVGKVRPPHQFKHWRLWRNSQWIQWTHGNCINVLYPCMFK